MMMMTISLMTATYMTMIMMKSPIQMTLMIIFIALLTASSFSLLMSSWYAFLIFLIYVGGMLVMFAYFTATSPNQQTTNPKKIILIMFISFMLSSLLMSYMNLNYHMKHEQYQIMSMFTSNNTYLLIGITIMLLMTMIIVVKLASRSKGPLRSFMT